MSEEKDYEAIGKYHVAKDELYKLLEMRGSLSRILDDIIRPLSHSSVHSGSVSTLNIEKLREKIDELCTVSEAIEVALNEVDAHVHAVGGRKISRH